MKTKEVKCYQCGNVMILPHTSRKKLCVTCKIRNRKKSIERAEMRRRGIETPRETIKCIRCKCEMEKPSRGFKMYCPSCGVKVDEINHRRYYIDNRDKILERGKFYRKLTLEKDPDYYRRAAEKFKKSLDGSL